MARLPDWVDANKPGHVAFRPATAEMVVTESSAGTVPRALLPVTGAAAGGHFLSA
ncbi:MAG: hypothetical protein V4679_10625 [Pseudomonadota bacterium]